MKKLNVGLIGAGFMGKAHSMAYVGMPMFFWPAPAIPVRKTIVDVNDSIAADAALRFGFEQSSSDWRSQLLKIQISTLLILQHQIICMQKLQSPQQLQESTLLARSHLHAVVKKQRQCMTQSRTPASCTWLPSTIAVLLLLH
jgi:hypothetical protein